MIESPRTTGWLVLAFVFLVYLLTSPGHLQTIDMTSQLAVGRSLVEHLTFAVPHGLGVRGTHGLFYSQHAIGESLLLLPAVVVGELAPHAQMLTTMAFVASLLTVTVAAATVSILYHFALDLGASVHTATVTGLAFAFCTMQWSYGHDAFDITPTACCLLLALFAGYRIRSRHSRGWLLVSGWAFACAALLRLPSITLWPVYVVYLYMGWPSSARSARLEALCIWSLPAVTVLALTGWYDWVRFGTPLQTGYGLGGDNGFSYPLWQGLVGLLISPGKSLFLYSPVLVFGLLGYPWFLRRDRSLALTVLAIVICTLVFYGRFNDWSGDWAWGPRFLLPLVPLFSISMIGVVEAIPGWDWWLRAGAWALGAGSLAVQLISVLVDYQVQMEIMLFKGTLPLMYWTPRYSQLVVQADTVWQVLRGTAIYPAVRLPHTQILRHSYPIRWDFWWITAWQANVHRSMLLVLLALNVASAIVLGARIVRGLAHVPGADTSAVRTRLGHVDVARHPGASLHDLPAPDM